LAAPAFLNQRALIVLAAAAFVVPRAFGLVEWNEGREKLTVHADYGINYDSNLLARTGSPGDIDQSLELGASYTRKAGEIGFSASASIVTARFQRYSNLNFSNPGVNMQLTKDDGRLTGSLAVSAQRESKSDDAANYRATSWHYAASLDLKYPINDRYYLTSTTDIAIRDYTPNTPLYNLSSYGEGIDLYYVYSSKLDLLGGYRIRDGYSAIGASTFDGIPGGGSNTLGQSYTKTRDEAFTIGCTGALLPKLSGTLRVGYQTREESGSDGGHYADMTGAFMLAWPMSKRIVFNFQTAEDFTTTATNISVNTTSFDLSATIKPNYRVKIALTGEAGYTISQFLGIKGDGRTDHTLSFLLKLSVPIKTHFAASLSLGYLTNESSYSFSKYDRLTAGLDLSLHY
jgi:hypothetical protein